MKSSIIILAACILAVPIALVMFALIPFALAYGASVDLFDREKSELRRENARLMKRIGELSDAEREFPVRCEMLADRMTRMFGML